MNRKNVLKLCVVSLIGAVFVGCGGSTVFIAKIPEANKMIQTISFDAPKKAVF